MAHLKEIDRIDRERAAAVARKQPVVPAPPVPSPGEAPDSAETEEDLSPVAPISAGAKGAEPPVKTSYLTGTGPEAPLPEAPEGAEKGLPKMYGICGGPPVYNLKNPPKPPRPKRHWQKHYRFIGERYPGRSFMSR